jgi:formaldehyde-activating enzyme involved in methanogenesis
MCLAWIGTILNESSRRVWYNNANNSKQAIKSNMSACMHNIPKAAKVLADHGNLSTNSLGHQPTQ